MSVMPLREDGVLKSRNFGAGGDCGTRSVSSSSSRSSRRMIIAHLKDMREELECLMEAVKKKSRSSRCRRSDQAKVEAVEDVEEYFDCCQFAEDSLSQPASTDIDVTATPGPDPMFEQPVLSGTVLQFVGESVEMRTIVGEEDEDYVLKEDKEDEREEEKSCAREDVEDEATAEDMHDVFEDEEDDAPTNEVSKQNLKKEMMDRVKAEGTEKDVRKKVYIGIILYIINKFIEMRAKATKLKSEEHAVTDRWMSLSRKVDAGITWKTPPMEYTERTQGLRRHRPKTRWKDTRRRRVGRSAGPWIRDFSPGGCSRLMSAP